MASNYWNMMEIVRGRIRELIKGALLKAVDDNVLPLHSIADILKDEALISIEKPKEKGHGDFSTNIAMQLAKKAKKAPIQIAGIITGNISLTGTGFTNIECAGPGFINFFNDNNFFRENLVQIMELGQNYGTSNKGEGKKVLVEFVSANPTGPLHMGNARGGALGDCIASVLSASGFNVTREFYINDAGNQIEKFGQSLEARYLQLTEGESAASVPEDGYHGEDVTEHVKAYLEEYGCLTLLEKPGERKEILARYALKRNLASIRKVLYDYGVNFDVWFSEQSLYDSGELDKTLGYLRQAGLTCMKEGAEWFLSSRFGLDKDEVLVRSNGTPTYFAADIAYHANKLKNRGFDRVINLLGADHHGHAGRMKAAVEAIGEDPSRLDCVIFQLVRLFKNGEIARMSKRTGRAISLSDLLEEVGRDAVRFFFNMKSAGSHLDFDLDLAVKESNENPVYYVQYAHARICNMKKLLESAGVYVPAPLEADLSLLIEPVEVELMKRLSELPDEMEAAANDLEPSRLTRYVLEVAAHFHSFYNACRVKGEEEKLMKARLVLSECTRIVISNVLTVLSITAPERM